MFKDLNKTETYRQIAAPRQDQPENIVFLPTRTEQRKLTQAAEKIVRQRMPFVATAGEDNRAVIKTEIGVPRNPVIKDNSVIQCDYGSQYSVNRQKKSEKSPFCPGIGEYSF